jgi:hypothetical protein
MVGKTLLSCVVLLAVGACLPFFIGAGDSDQGLVARVESLEKENKDLRDAFLKLAAAQGEYAVVPLEIHILGNSRHAKDDGNEAQSYYRADSANHQIPLPSLGNGTAIYAWYTLSDNIVDLIAFHSISVSLEGDHLNFTASQGGGGIVHATIHVLVRKPVERAPSP